MGEFSARNDIDGALQELGFPQNVVSSAARVRQYIQNNGLNNYSLFERTGNGYGLNIDGARNKDRLVGALAKTKQQIDAALNGLKQGNYQAYSSNDPILQVILAVIQTGQEQTGANVRSSADTQLGNRRIYEHTDPTAKGLIGKAKNQVQKIRDQLNGNYTDVSNGNYYDYRERILAQYQQGNSISVDAELGIPVPAQDPALLKDIRNWINKYKTEFSKTGYDDSTGASTNVADPKSALARLDSLLKARDNILRRQGFASETGVYDCNTTSNEQTDNAILDVQEDLINLGAGNERYFDEICSLICTSAGKPFPNVYNWMLVDFSSEEIDRTGDAYRSGLAQ